MKVFFSFFVNKRLNLLDWIKPFLFIWSAPSCFFLDLVWTLLYDFFWERLQVGGVSSIWIHVYGSFPQLVWQSGISLLWLYSVFPWFSALTQELLLEKWEIELFYSVPIFIFPSFKIFFFKFLFSSFSLVFIFITTEETKCLEEPR